MTKAEHALAAIEEHYRKCEEAWKAVHHEAQHAYGIWQAANERRLRLAVERNNAWGQLEMARATVAADTRWRGKR